MSSERPGKYRLNAFEWLVLAALVAYCAYLLIR